MKCPLALHVGGVYEFCHRGRLTTNGRMPDLTELKSGASQEHNVMK